MTAAGVLRATLRFYPTTMPDTPIPQFGDCDPDAAYTLRPGGYAVIVSERGEVAVVLVNGRGYLPGGGQEVGGVGESPEQAAVREAREECGLSIRILSTIGVADELIHARAEGRHCRKRGTFFRAEVLSIEPGAGEPDHQLVWLPPAEAINALHHESQRWAVRQAFNPAAR